MFDGRYGEGRTVLNSDNSFPSSVHLETSTVLHPCHHPSDMSVPTKPISQYVLNILLTSCIGYILAAIIELYYFVKYYIHTSKFSKHNSKIRQVVEANPHTF